MSDDSNKEPPEHKPHVSNETIENIKGICFGGTGYQRPPKDTRFKKGQSGNPNGRPKSYDLGFGSSRSANAIALKEGERLISVREGAETREMKIIEAVFRKQIATALANNAYAQKHVIETYRVAEDEERERRLRSVEIWKEYQERMWEKIEDAKRGKETPPSPLPHPDDIVIDYEKGVRFNGPIDEGELATLQSAMKIRDVLIMQHAFDQRGADEPEPADPEDGSAAMLQAILIDMHMPERFKISRTELLIRAMRYDAMPKRALLKELYRAWREVGRPKPRGYTFPSIRVFRRARDSVTDLLEKAKQGASIEELASELELFLSNR